ncbi:MAG TPA: thioredoxin domain-containing protein [Thermoanaerobaculia bacterium]|nr:thioredoxin domain-containing protein [Thermoanaerobaculia bacterium]
MKRLALALPLLLAVSSVKAQEIASAVDMTAVRNYVSQMLPRCPGSSITFDPIAQRGPSRFHVYRAVVSSSDEHCGTAKYILYSPTTHQTIVGSIIAVPGGEKPVHVRLSEHTSQLLNADIKAMIAPMALPDGLKQVSLQRDTDYGPFSYTGYLDESQRFLIVGLRGNLNEDPAVTLRKAIGLDAAARRGNGAAKIEIVEISDFQCPTCARAHDALEPLFATHLGKIRYSRIDLPLFEHHKWALPAAMGARAVQRVAPNKYWRYVAAIFKNQATLTEANVDEFVKNWIEDNDVNWTAVSKIYNSAAERKALLESVSRLFNAGINSTPTFIVNGQIIGYGTGQFAQEFMKETLGVN